MEQKQDLFECDICGLHYRREMLAKQCHDWCASHNGSCNISITTHSVEAESRTRLLMKGE